MTREIDTAERLPECRMGDGNTPVQDGLCVECAPSAPLTLERLIRTAVQVALAEAGDRDGDGIGLSGVAIEDRALERVQVLLTPEAREALAAELAPRRDLIEQIDTWRTTADVQQARAEAAEARVRELQAAADALIDRAISVEGYVGATISPHNTFPHDHKGHGDPSDWRLAHAGRMASSARQLEALVKEARALRDLSTGKVQP